MKNGACVNFEEQHIDDNWQSYSCGGSHSLDCRNLAERLIVLASALFRDLLLSLPGLLLREDVL